MKLRGNMQEKTVPDNDRVSDRLSWPILPGLIRISHCENVWGWCRNSQIAITLQDCVMRNAGYLNAQLAQQVFEVY